MGVIYLAQDLTLDRRVAIKVVHPDLSTNRVVAARFLTEARTIAKLRHPNIVAVHAAGEVDGQLYYVMDYLPGETLRQRLTREPKLDVAVALRIAADIADALDAASAAGVIHRDLKPENVLLEGAPNEPRALLADFGIARLVEGGGGHTGPGAVMGTPAYMSPEQAAGEDLDGRSDLYSLGVVTYEMLGGAPPFSGPHRAIISKQILDAPAPLDSLRANLPGTVSGAVMRALEKVPDARWPSGRAFRRALTGEETTPTPTAIVRRSPSRRFLPALVALGVALIAVIALVTRRDGPPRGVNPRHSILILPFDNLRDDPKYEWLREGSVNMLSLALSQWRDLTVVDQDRVHDLLSSAGPEGPIGLELARRMARESRVWTVVLGDFTRVGDSLFLAARRYDVATGKRIDLIQVAGVASDDVRPLFDQLATKLLDLTGAPQTDRATLSSVTTGSLEAYRAYLRGVDALNHWRLNEASEALREAVRLDSSFSLANYKLAIARGWVSPTDTLGRVAIRRAARTSDRLPPRERSLIDGYKTFVEGDYQRGITVYGDLVRKDSTDVEAWYGMADAAFHGGYAHRDLTMLNQSLNGFRRVIGLDSTFGLAYEHIGAILNDAGQPRGWLVLENDDSLAEASQTRSKAIRDSARAPARQRAVAEAIAVARAWTRLQPATSRAHYHLYKALLSDHRVPEARQEVVQLRGLLPDSLQVLLSLFDARAKFVAGDLKGAAQTVRTALPEIRPTAFADLDFAPEPLLDITTGVSALGYFGDLQGAAQLIRLGRDIQQVWNAMHDSAAAREKVDLWELPRLGLLYGASGTRSDRLRAFWERGVNLVKATPAERRAERAAALAPVAIGLLIGVGDASAVAELERLTGQRPPAVVRALMAARAGDSTGSRRFLAEAMADRDPEHKTAERDYGPSDPRPILAETYFELGDHRKVVEVLEGFGPSEFATRGFDPRWIILPRVRLLRGQALDRLGRPAEAAVEYQAVIDQWSGADTELLPVVQQARRRLASLAGTPEAR
jgi:serine/threonine-protein kinase